MQKLPVNYMEKRHMQLKFYPVTQFYLIIRDKGFFLKVSGVDSKVLMLEYLGAKSYWS